MKPGQNGPPPGHDALGRPLCGYCDQSRSSHERDANGVRTTTGHCSARVALGDGVSGSCSCTAYVEGKE